ncbi:MAG: FkbM family methyltransferase [Xanthomonadaceae bacterium]|nr:FkbM family methyltransferase [Xanthomonadaceae bacterium]
MEILSWLRSIDRARRNRRFQGQREAFDAVLRTLGPGDLALDCGANVGEYTVRMARTGATVHAFEPNRVAFDALSTAVAGFPNVTLHHAALVTSAGPVKLYLHHRAKSDPLLRSVSSSLIVDKSNVSPEDFEMVEGIDIVAFMRELGAPVKLLKMDVEGAEVGLINRLLDVGLHEGIGHAFVEVHDRSVPSLREPTQALRERLAALGATNFRLDWR